MEEEAPAPYEPPDFAAFRNAEATLEQQALQVVEARNRAGIDQLVGPLVALIVNTEPDRQQPATAELLRYTGFHLEGIYEEADGVTAVLQCAGSASILVRSRRGGGQRANPFAALNDSPKSRHLPNTRLETYVFEVSNLREYVAVQRGRGISFLTDGIVDAGAFLFIHTPPSEATGNSLGFVEFRDGPRNFCSARAKPLHWPLAEPPGGYQGNIGRLDHLATRVTASDRAAAIVEFLDRTGHHYDFAIYVESFNSITNVTRHREQGPAVVFTSGIRPYQDERTSGPTEKFVHNYGPRTHHLAFDTRDIDRTFRALKADGMEFLLELVGSPEEGLKQTFSAPSPHTLLVAEYIHRYGDFDGFFTRSNVTALTGATDKQ